MSSTGIRQFCTFLIDGVMYGIAVEHVQEIIRHLPTTRIPLAPDSVAGLINLRGQIVPAIDVRRCIGAAARTGDALPTNVVVNAADGTVSFLVDDVGDVLEVSEADYEPPPEHLRGNRRHLLEGVYKLESGLMTVVAIEELISLATQRIRDTGRSTHASKEFGHGTN